MSVRPTSRKRSRSYLSGLYATLEAAVREGDEASTCCDEHWSGCAVDEESSGERDEASAVTPVNYPFPILWSEEMTAAHLDSYHSSYSRPQPAFNDLGGERHQTQHGCKPTPTRAHLPTHCGAPTGAVTGDDRPERQSTKTLANIKSLRCTGPIRTEEAPDACGGSSSEKTHESLPMAAASSPTIPVASEKDRTPSAQSDHPENPVCPSSAVSLQCIAPNPSSRRTGPQVVLTPQQQPSQHASQHQAPNPPGPPRDGASTAGAAPDSTRSSQMSQATEMSLMVLSGLPSQVHLDPYSHSDPWEESEAHHAGTSSLSELPPPASPPHRAYNELPDGAAGCSGVPCITQAGGLRGNDDPQSSHPSAVARPPATTFDRATRERQHQEFTRALENSFGRQAKESTYAGAGDAETGSVGGGQPGPPPAPGGGSGAQQSAYVLVPREEALPRRLLGEPAQAIALLERHLERVREGAPNGYVARALELACHVLSQPTVCVRVSSRARGMDGAAPGSAGPGEGCSGEHAEVVGVAGIVWEILRAGNTPSFSAGGKKG